MERRWFWLLLFTVVSVWAAPRSAWGAQVGCVECAQLGKVASSDGAVCQGCNATLSGCDCVCPSGHLLIEVDSTGRYLPTKFCRECIDCACADLQGMHFSGGSCVCVSSAHSIYDSRVCLNTAGQTVVTNQQSNANTRNTVTFKGHKESIDTSATSATVLSKHFQNNLMTAAVRCMQEKSNSSCANLASLCILTAFDSSSTACQLYSTALSGVGGGRASTHAPNNADLFPWIDYSFSSLEDAKTNLLESASYAPSFPVDFETVLSFKVKEYDFDGTFLEKRDLTNELQLCPSDQKTPTSLKYRNFARNHYFSCNLNLNNFQALNRTRFYEIYVVDTANSNTEIAVPVHINFEGDSDAVIDANFNLYKRFFLVDNVAGVDSSGVLTKVRFAVDTELRVTLRSGSSGLIHVPELFLLYGARTLAASDTPSLSLTSEDAALLSPQVTFHSTYTMDLSNYFSGTSVGFIIACVLAFLVMYVRVRNYNRRRQLSIYDVLYFTQVAVQGISSLGDTLFVLLLGLSLYWILFFKGQSSISILLPVGSEGIAGFQILVILAFTGKLIHVLYQLYQQVTQIIFFIDWERPRGKLEKKEKEQHSHNDDEQKKKRPTMAPVSIWRSVLVANEWNELANSRLVSTPLIILIVLGLLDGAKWRWMRTAQPDAKELSDDEHIASHFFLSFAITLLVFSGTVVGARLFNWAFYAPYVKNALENFVDLCSINNVSVFLLKGGYQTGYYVHGRSVHSHADCDMAQFHKNLALEERHAVPKRGLASTDQQCYEVLVSRKFLDRYNNEYLNLLENQRNLDKQQAKAMAMTNTPGGPSTLSNLFNFKNATRALKSSLIRKHFEISKVLQTSLNKAADEIQLKNFAFDHFQVTPNLDFIFGPALEGVNGQPLPPTCCDWSQMCAGMGMGVGMNPQGQTQGGPMAGRVAGPLRMTKNQMVLFEDPKRRVRETMLSGMEWDLMMVSALLWAMIESFSGGALYTAAIVVYAFNVFFDWVYGYRSEINLTNKTLVDDRLLL